MIVVVGEGEFGHVEGKRGGCAIGEAGAFVVVGFGVGPVLLELEGFPGAELQQAGVCGVARVQRLVRHRLSHHRHTPSWKRYQRMDFDILCPHHSLPPLIFTSYHSSTYNQYFNLHLITIFTEFNSVNTSCI